jgi:CheY-like chemotaxis protein
MSLAGNLEDLGLGDILQIVSLSRKSGILSLRDGVCEGKIFFSKGQVIRAWCSTSKENIGDLLVRRQLVSSETLVEAVAMQRLQKSGMRLGSILVEYFNIDRATIEEALREQVEQAVYSFFSWRRGTFEFELGEPEELAATNFNPLQFMLEQGLNPQWLALEGSRLLDEKKRGRQDAGDGDNDIVFSRISEMPQRSPQAKLTAPRLSVEALSSSVRLVIVDDDENTRNVLLRALTQRGIEVRPFADSRSLLEALQGWQPGDTPPLFLVDLIMATLDGEGIFGGLELAEKLLKIDSSLRVVLMTDHSDRHCLERAQALGLHDILRKPAKIVFRDTPGHLMVSEFIDRLLGKIEPFFPGEQEKFFDIGRELRREQMDLLSEGQVSLDGQAEPMSRLKAMIVELGSGPAVGRVPLLALRMAADHFSRALIFAVRRGKLLGLGQFGPGTQCLKPNGAISEIIVPAQGDSIFTQALQKADSGVYEPIGGTIEQTFFSQLVDPPPQELFIGPILCGGEAAYLLYGDNLNKPVGDTRALELFLIFSGLSLEREYLEQQLHERSAV